MHIGRPYPPHQDQHHPAAAAISTTDQRDGNMIPGIGVHDLWVPTSLPPAGVQRAGTLPASTIDTSVNGSEMNGGGQLSGERVRPLQTQQSGGQGGHALYSNPASAPRDHSSVSSTSVSATQLPSDVCDIDDEVIDLGGPPVSIVAGPLSSGVARYADEEYEPLLKGMGSWVNERVPAIDWQ